MDDVPLCGMVARPARGAADKCASGAAEPPSSLSWSCPFPPVAWWLVPDHRGRLLHLEEVAELPQLLRRPRVLEEDPINVERVELAGTVAIDSLPDAGDEFSQLCLVIVRHHDARRSSLRLAGHEHEATQKFSFAAEAGEPLRGMVARWRAVQLYAPSWDGRNRWASGRMPAGLGRR
jgi:hypothetical protein